MSSSAPHLRVEYGRVVTVAAINDPGPPVAGRQPPGEHGDKCTGEYHLGAHHEYHIINLPAATYINDFLFTGKLIDKKILSIIDLCQRHVQLTIQLM